MTEIQALQNFANDLELFVHEKFEQDKRKTTKKYFLTLNGTSVSPVLDYENMNAFLMGWLNCTKHGANAPKNADVLPPAIEYGENIRAASAKFGLSIDKCREQFGTYTISQWKGLLGGDAAPENKNISIILSGRL